MIGQLDPGQAQLGSTGTVDEVLRRDGQARTVGAQEDLRWPPGGRGRYQEQLSHRGERDRGLGPAEYPAVAGPIGPRRRYPRVIAVRLGERGRDDKLPGGG